jgi:hypothetical protein
MAILVQDVITLQNGLQLANLILSIKGNVSINKEHDGIYARTQVYYFTETSYVSSQQVPITCTNLVVQMPEEELNNVFTFIYTQIKGLYNNCSDI